MIPVRLHVPSKTTARKPTPAVATLPEALLTKEQAAERLSTKPRFIRRLIEQGRIPHYRVGRFIRIDPADLAAFLAAARVEPDPNRGRW
jgi:excisionase family DNA binding protein